MEVDFSWEEFEEATRYSQDYWTVRTRQALDMPISEEQLEVLISETPLEVPKEEDI
jgi:hypothetical protein